MTRFSVGERYCPICPYDAEDYVTSCWSDDYPIVLSRNDDTVELDDTYRGHDDFKVEIVNGVEVIRNVFRIYGEKWLIRADKTAPLNLR